MFSVNITDKFAIDAKGNSVPLRTFQDDYKYGIEQEDIMLPLIKTEFKDDTIKNTKEIYDCYCKWDWEAEDGTRFEQKARRNTKAKYPTTILPVHKVVSGGNGNHYYIFQFTDVNCYIKYDEQVFSKFNTRYIRVERQGRVENNLHYEIPIKLLIDF